MRFLAETSEVLCGWVLADAGKKQEDKPVLSSQLSVLRLPPQLHPSDCCQCLFEVDKDVVEVLDSD